MTFIKSAAIAMALTAFGVSPAVAQEQENPSTPGQIPDPGTYQGSTVLQQQSDQQAQQYRQQQQQQQGYQQPMQSYSGGSRQWGSAPGPYPAAICNQQLAASTQFSPLAGKITLGSADPRAIELFGNPSRPTATEKALIARWAEGKRHCAAVWYSSSPRPTPAQRVADSRWGYPVLLSLIHQLIAGQLTYGQFSYRRAMNQVSIDRYMAAHR